MRQQKKQWSPRQRVGGKVRKCGVTESKKESLKKERVVNIVSYNMEIIDISKNGVQSRSQIRMQGEKLEIANIASAFLERLAMNG